MKRFQGKYTGFGSLLFSTMLQYDTTIQTPNKNIAMRRILPSTLSHLMCLRLVLSITVFLLSFMLSSLLFFLLYLYYNISRVGLRSLESPIITAIKGISSSMPSTTLWLCYGYTGVTVSTVIQYTRSTTIWYALAANVIEEILCKRCLTLPPTFLGVSRHDAVPGLVFCQPFGSHQRLQNSTIIAI